MLRLFAAFALTLLTAAPLSAQRAAPMDSLELGRKATDWFYHGQTDSLWYHQADTAGLGSRAEYARELQLRLQVLIRRAGFEDSLMTEEFVKRNSRTQYWRTARFTMNEDPIMIRWAIVDGRIAGMGMNPARLAPQRE